MPRRPKAPPTPIPVQLPLFPERVSLARVKPELNEWRFYRLEVWPDLFGRALLVRSWGRIGTQGRMRLDLHTDTGAAVNALATIARSKARRGYGIRLAG
jgi:predicted DNA-binding WGR domain protein